jgi:polyhydroxyalkanoate synthase subunit PhaC
MNAPAPDGTTARHSRLWSWFRDARGRVGQTPCDVVHEENGWRLLRYRARPGGLAHRTPIVMVPSLINRHYVLDLMPGKSLVEWLVARGHDVLCLDWGAPADEDRYRDFDDTDRAIGRALTVACRLSGRPRAHLLGYCIGGTLTVMHAARWPERVASLAVLAAPVSFRDAGILGAWTRTKSFDVAALVDATGNVPWQLMQSAFLLLRPTLGLSKAVGVLDKFWDDTFLDGFFALETWGNDNVSMPGAFYRRYITELYRGDALIAGRFSLAGRPLRLGDVRCPTLAVTFEHDNIVPAASAACLLDLVGTADKRRIHLPGGHVGAVVSRKACQALWPQLAAWWAERDEEPRAT